MALTLALCVSSARADENILLNGDFAEGTKGKPSHWVGQTITPTSEMFSWVHPSGGPGELRISESVTSFAQWSQATRLTPGWYYLSGEMRVEGIDPRTGSAMIGLCLRGRTFALPQAAVESSGWRAGGMYFKVGDEAYDAQVVCALAGTPGRAFFRKIRLTRLTAPPRQAITVDLDAIFRRRARLEAIREHRFAPKPFSTPRGSRWTVVATMMLLAAIALSGWVALGSARPAHEGRTAHET